MSRFEPCSCSGSPNSAHAYNEGKWVPASEDVLLFIVTNRAQLVELMHNLFFLDVSNL